MARQRIQIKRIDNLAARQVTFSKRRKGLFKKALELSTLCDVDVALLVFSATGKLFEYSSSSMTQLIQRQNEQSDMSKLWEQPLSIQGSNDHAMLRRRLMELNIEYKHLMGEDLEELGLDELIKLEKLVVGGLNNVERIKNGRLIDEMRMLKTKNNELMEANTRFKKMEGKCEEIQKKKFSERNALDQGSSPESNPNFLGSDTSLKLGLPHSDSTNWRS